MQARIWNKRAWLSVTHAGTLSMELGEMLEIAGFSVLGECEHHFAPQGYTKLWLLGESHLAIHTFPEEGKTYLELSSCNEKMFQRFLAKLEATFDEIAAERAQ